LLDLAGSLEAFRVASAFTAPERRVTYECSVVSVRGGPLRTVDGVELVTDSVCSLSRKPIDTLIVPGAFAVDDVTRDRAMVQWVRRRAASCRRVRSVCVGSVLLAAAGLLDARRAATHWMHAPLLATRHPRVTVEPDAIFVRDGAIWSSAGVTTGIDLAPALIEQDAGPEVAMNVARILVVYLKRAGGQSQFSALLAAQAESEFESFGELERAGLRPALAFFSVSLRISAGWCRSAGCGCAWPERVGRREQCERSIGVSCRRSCRGRSLGIAELISAIPNDFTRRCQLRFQRQ
jgi:transcriptional regulator GlxA family with amidase domain